MFPHRRGWGCPNRYRHPVRPAGQQVRRLSDGRQNARLGDHVSHKIILRPKGQHRPVHSSLNHGGVGKEAVLPHGDTPLQSGHHPRPEITQLRSRRRFRHRRRRRRLLRRHRDRLPCPLFLRGLGQRHISLPGRKVLRRRWGRPVGRHLPPLFRHRPHSGLLPSAGRHGSAGQQLLHPAQPGIQPRRRIIHRLITKPDQTQFHIHPLVGAAPQLGGRALQLPQHLDQPRCGQRLRQPPDRSFIIAPGQQTSASLGGCAADQQVPGQGSQLPHQAPHLLPRRIEPFQPGQCRPGIVGGHLPHQSGGLHIARQPQSGKDLLLPQRLLLGAGGTLVQQRKCVPHPAVRQPGQQIGPGVGQMDALLPRHIFQPPGNVHGRDPLKRKLLASGFDGGRYLVQLRSGQNEHQMLRRLLQNFQQGVEGGGGEHMHLVHDIHPLAHGSRGIDRLVPQRPHLVHPVVGGSVQFQYLHHRAVLDALTGIAFIAGIAVHRMLAVHRPCQYLGAGGLSRAPGAGKQVSVGKPPLLDLPFQCLCNMALPHHVVKRAGPPFAVEGLIHGGFTSYFPALGERRASVCGGNGEKVVRFRPTFQIFLKNFSPPCRRGTSPGQQTGKKGRALLPRCRSMARPHTDL